MSIQQAAAIGIAADEMSKRIVGSDEVSAPRTAISTALGGASALIVTEAVVITAGALGASALATAAAPIIIPLAVASAAFGFLKSLF